METGHLTEVMMAYQMANPSANLHLMSLAPIGDTVHVVPKDGASLEDVNNLAEFLKGEGFDYVTHHNYDEGPNTNADEYTLEVSFTGLDDLAGLDCVRSMGIAKGMGVLVTFDKKPSEEDMVYIRRSFDMYCTDGRYHRLVLALTEGEVILDTLEANKPTVDIVKVITDEEVADMLEALEGSQDVNDFLKSLEG